MLEVRELRCGYGTGDVVKGVCFGVAEGEIVCLMGPNGCGKTTLLRAVAGILPYEGQVLFEGMDLARVQRVQRARKIALFSQISSVYFAYTVYDTVMMGRYAHLRGVLRTPSQADRETVQRCMRAVGVWEIRDSLITELSGGQLQRVMLARLFAQDPKLILLDEPANHLDIRYQKELLDFLRSWVGEGGRAVLGVFHDITTAMQLADRLALMKDGQICAQGGGRDVVTAMNDVYEMDVAGYMRQISAMWQSII